MRDWGISGLPSNTDGMASNQPAQQTDLPMVRGAIAGVAAWLIGYLLTYLVVAPDIKDTATNQLIDAFGGSPPTFEMVGWVFYNAHFVDTVVRDIPLLGGQTSFIGGQDGFSVVLYLVPIGLLVAAGLAVARRDGVNSPSRGALSALTVVPGYLVLSIAGVFLFEVPALGGRMAPDLLPAIVVAGIIFPLAFAGAGGAIAGYLERRRETTRE